MDDLISRQAAIDAINHICPVDTEYDCTLLDWVDVRCVLSDLPPAEPERQQGEWDMFQRITTAYNWKQCYFLQENGLVYSRLSHTMMTRDDAIKEFLNEIYNN